VKAETLSTRVKRKVWTRVFGQQAWVQKFGDFRNRERHSLVPRPNYAYGMLRAADTARYFGYRCVSVIEFGVASGAGLLNMAKLAEAIVAETGIEIRIIGFDTGAGLPVVEGYKDHPEIWNPGDFATEDRCGLLKKLGGRAEMIWGDISHTIDPFVARLSEDAPVGFVSIDVDIYSATRSALRLFVGPPTKYLPAVSMYFDDVSFYFANKWAGELAAIEEFNAENPFCKIDQDRSLANGHRPTVPQSWYNNMYVCHKLDHPARQLSIARPQLTIKEHAQFMAERALF
jgi:hypothetical protein